MWTNWIQILIWMKIILYIDDDPYKQVLNFHCNIFSVDHWNI